MEALQGVGYAEGKGSRYIRIREVEIIKIWLIRVTRWKN
jgi:hypothetical protein